MKLDDLRQSKYKAPTQLGEPTCTDFEEQSIEVDSNNYLDKDNSENANIVSNAGTMIMGYDVNKFWAGFIIGLLISVITIKYTENSTTK